MVKRGQISLFIIIGIVILVLFGIVLSLRQEQFSDFEIGDTSAVSSFTSACIKETLEKGVINVGYDSLSSLESYVNTNLGDCTGDYSEFKEYTITSGPIDSEVTISDNNESLIAKVDYSLKVSKGKATQELNDFIVETPLITETKLVPHETVIASSSDLVAQLEIPGNVIPRLNGQPYTEIGVSIENTDDS